MIFWFVVCEGCEGLSYADNACCVSFFCNAGSDIVKEDVAMLLLYASVPRRNQCLVGLFG